MNLLRKYTGRPVRLALIIIAITSCSTIKTVDSQSISISSKTWIKSALTCVGVGLIAGVLARKYSPNKESKNGNMLMFGTGGCALGGVAAGAISHLSEKEELKKLNQGDEYLYQNHVTPLGGKND